MPPKKRLPRSASQGVSEEARHDCALSACHYAVGVKVTSRTLLVEQCSAGNGET